MASLSWSVVWPTWPTTHPADHHVISIAFAVVGLLVKRHRARYEGKTDEGQKEKTKGVMVRSDPRIGLVARLTTVVSSRVSRPESAVNESVSHPFKHVRVPPSAMSLQTSGSFETAVG